jgi:hypothetical protein
MASTRSLGWIESELRVQRLACRLQAQLRLSIELFCHAGSMVGERPARGKHDLVIQGVTSVKERHVA